MKSIITTCLIFILMGCVPLVRKHEIEAEIYQYGLYETVGEYFTEENRKVPSGKIGRSTGGVRFVRQTDKIPLSFGVRFGYDFRIYGLPGESVTLKCLITHPPITRFDGKVSTNFEYESVFDVVGSVVDDGADYYMNHDYELVPGKWTRSYFLDGKRILYKEFEVSNDYNKL